MHLKKIVLFIFFFLIIINSVFCSESDDISIMNKILRVLSFRDYNTRIVIFGTMLLGLACGIIGTFMLLRKRSLMADAISHATLPGIGIAFILMVVLTKGTGKSLIGLLTGALISGLIGMGIVIMIQKLTRIKEEAALGIVLSVFFGFGISILGIIQKMKTGHAAGLESFIYGKTASMLLFDAWMILITAFIITVMALLFLKEFTILCFDEGFAHSQGLPVLFFDVLLISLVIIVTVIGLQAVGLILIIALLIIPSVSARFWTDKLVIMIIISAFFGGISSACGAVMSAVFSKLPAGAVIVVTAGVFFFLSFIFGKAHGIFIKFIIHLHLVNKVNLQHLLRLFFEYFETSIKKFRIDTKLIQDCSISFDKLLELKSWNKRQLRITLFRAKIKGLITNDGINKFKLTKLGCDEALRVVKNHRLWELYLITYAEMAAGKVDRDADRLEHVLGKDIVKNLEELLEKEYPHLIMPESPHPLKN